MARQKNLFERVVEISNDYLGPAAERFIARQIETHLKKSPAKLNKSDLKPLAEWLKLSFAVLTNDKKLIDEYIGKISRLSK